MARRTDDDESVAFESSAFDVVSSWLLGGRSAAALAADEDNNDDGNDNNESSNRTRAPVTLYRPTASVKPSLTGRTTAAGDTKVLTDEEKEMRKKLLRKSGSYKAALETEAESALKVAQDEELDREEQALIAARNARGLVSNSSDKASAASSSHAPVPAAANDERNPKKRKLNAQDELLEKLRQDAARAKAKNQKAKQRQQRKKEEERKQRELAVAQATDAR